MRFKILVGIIAIILFTFARSKNHLFWNDTHASIYKTDGRRYN